MRDDEGSLLLAAIKVFHPSTCLMLTQGRPFTFRQAPIRRAPDLSLPKVDACLFRAFREAQAWPFTVCVSSPYPRKSVFIRGWSLSSGLFASIRGSYWRFIRGPALREIFLRPLLRVHSRLLFASIRGPCCTPSIAKLSIYFDDCCCNGLSFWNSGDERHRSASARLGNSITTTR